MFYSTILFIIICLIWTLTDTLHTTHLNKTTPIEEDCPNGATAVPYDWLSVSIKSALGFFKQLTNPKTPQIMCCSHDNRTAAFTCGWPWEVEHFRGLTHASPSSRRHPAYKLSFGENFALKRIELNCNQLQLLHRWIERFKRRWEDVLVCLPP